MSAYISYCNECDRYVDRHHYIYHAESEYDKAIPYILTGKKWK